SPEPPGPIRRLRDELSALRFGERLRIALFRDLCVLAAVRDVRSVASVQHLKPGAEIRDDPVGIRLLFETDHLERSLERDRVRVVIAQGYVFVAVFDVRTEAPDVRDDRLARRRRAERAREFEKLERLGECDRVHLLPGAQSRETRLLLVLFGADLYEGPVAAHSHRHGLARRRIAPELARL